MKEEVPLDERSDSWERDVTVLLPTYNERGNIIPLIEAIKERLAGIDFEIIVVDDDSPDETWRLVESMANDDDRVWLLRRTENRGLASSLWDGVEAARGGIVVWMDCDFQMPPATIPELIAGVEGGVDAVIGSRFIAGGGDQRYDESRGHGRIVAVHRWLSWLISAIPSALLRVRHSDWTSGFIAIKRDVVRELGLHGDHGEYFIYLVHDLARSGRVVKEIPYVLGARRAGRSKSAGNYLGLLVNGLKYLRVVLRLTFFSRGRRVARR